MQLQILKWGVSMPGTSVFVQKPEAKMNQEKPSRFSKWIERVMVNIHFIVYALKPLSSVNNFYDARNPRYETPIDWMFRGF